MSQITRRPLPLLCLLILAALPLAAIPPSITPPSARAAGALFQLGWSSAALDDTVGIALGDLDHDGDLDLVVGNSSGMPSRVYFNNGSGFDSPGWASPVGKFTRSAALGDMDGDGDLDLATGNSGSSHLYLNDGATLTASPVWSSTEFGSTYSVAWGDVDKDGDLDLAVGNASVSSRLYRNDGGMLTTSAVWSTDASYQTYSVAWGDVDGDGDLDLAAGNHSLPNQVYRNDSGVLTSSAAWSSAESDKTFSVAWGDVDGDGDLDLAVGNQDQPNRVYRNDSGVLTASAVWSSAESDTTASVAWGDMDGDGDLDLAAGNGGYGTAQPSRVYRNDNGVLTTSAVWSSPESDNTNSVAWGDIDGNGSLDLVVGNIYTQPDRVYLNRAPVIKAPVTGGIRDVTIHENTGTEPLAFTLADPDTPLDELQISATSSAPALVNPSAITITGSGAERAITISPTQTSAPDRLSAQGSATITLSVSDGAQTAKRSFKVTIAPPTWLAMLYLAGDDLPGPATLSWAVQDILTELERMPYNPAVRIVVLADSNTATGSGASRVLVREPGGLVDLTATAALSAGWAGWPTSNELDTGSHRTLTQFITWANATYPGAQHTFLALMDHGGGWAPDFTTGAAQPSNGGMVKSGGWRGMAMDLAVAPGSTMATKDTYLALSNALPPGQHIDVLFFDACLMGMIESAYEVRAFADYLVVAENLLYSSEDLRSYAEYLAAASLGATTSPQDLAQAIVTRYGRVTDQGVQITQSYNPFTIATIDLRRLRDPGNLAERVNTLAERLLAAYGDATTLYAALQPAYAQAQKFDYDGDQLLEATEGYVDLGHLAALLRDRAGLPQVVRDAAAAVVAELGPTVVSIRRESGSYGGAAWDFRQATGLAIFAPLGEQDWRPTRTPSAAEQLTSGCFAVSENQRLYYTAPQLQFVQTAPRWADMLAQVEPAVPIIHAPCLPQGSSALASAPSIDSSPFYTPGQLDLSWVVNLPSIQR